MKFTNRMPTLILLLLSLALLSSCLQRAPGSEGLTTENNSETEAPLMGLEYTLEMPSQELQERFVNEYIAYQKYEPDTHPPFKMVSWYGSYGDIHFLMIEDGDYHDAEWIDRVADYSFEYSYGNQIKVWVEGRFLNIDDAYVKKFITKDMVAEIADAHDTKSYLYVNGNLAMNSSMEALINQIENNYSSQDSSFDGVYCVKNYYGVYNGCIPIMFDVPESGALRDVSIADIVVHYNGGNSIIVWCDGEFLSLNDAYEQNMLTVDHVSLIANLHNNGTYISLIPN